MEPRRIYDYRSIACNCGEVALGARGEPFVSTVSRCSSCEEAGSLLERLPLSTPVLEADGGTHFVLFRKDRVVCLKGEKLLAEHRLRPESPTRRVVATCCNTAMFLDFTKGHWLSVYRKRVPMADELLARKAGYFLPRLIWAWGTTGFRIPRIDYVTRRLPDIA
jgi:hypothetical protein